MNIKFSIIGPVIDRSNKCRASLYSVPAWFIKAVFHSVKETCCRHEKSALYVHYILLYLYIIFRDNLTKEFYDAVSTLIVVKRRNGAIPLMATRCPM